MRLEIHSQIGRYARDLNISFNGKVKRISAFEDTAEFEFENCGEYILSIKQIDEDRLGVFSQIILTIINCFKIMISLYNLESFDFADYYDMKPLLLEKEYKITLNESVDIDLSYTDSHFSSDSNEFSVPAIRIENFIAQDEKTKIACNVELPRLRKKQLDFTLSAIVFICFLLVSFVGYSAILCNSGLAVCICTVILLFVIAVYIISLLKISSSYKEIINKLSTIKEQYNLCKDDPCH